MRIVQFRSVEGINEFEARWIGWAGVNVPDKVGQRSLTKALAEKVCSFKDMLNCNLPIYSSAILHLNVN